MLATRVVVFDQESAGREAIVRALEKDPRLQVVASAGTVREALRQIEAHNPKVLVIADRLPGVRGLALTSALRRQLPRVGVVLLVERFDIDASVAAVEADAAGLIWRRMPEEELLQTVRAVAKDANPVHERAMAEPEIMAQLLAGFRAGFADDLTVSRYDPGVSLHLLGVLDEVVRGMTTHEMSEEENTSERTVKRNVSTLMAVLGVRDRMGIVREAVLHDWVAIGPEATEYRPPWQPVGQHGAAENWQENPPALFGMTTGGWLPTPDQA
ncbi:MAG: response regulator transcription factor [Thermomicrobiales bacterium]